MNVATWSIERCHRCGAQYFGPGPCPLHVESARRPSRERTASVVKKPTHTPVNADLNAALRDLAREFKLSVRTEKGIVTIRLHGYGAHRRGQVRPHLGMLSEFSAYLQVPKDERGRPGSLPTGLAARGLRDESGEGYLRAEGPAGALIRYALAGPSWLRPEGRETQVSDREKGHSTRGLEPLDAELVPEARDASTAGVSGPSGVARG